MSHSDLEMAGDALALGLSDADGWSGSTYRLGANRVGRNMCNATQDDDRFGAAALSAGLTAELDWPLMRSRAAEVAAVGTPSRDKVKFHADTR
jgi:hypothetical protein